jgi:hypothetical protein
MKLKEGLVNKGRPFQIPNTLRRDFPAFFKEMGYKVGAEVGVYRGNFSKGFCEEGFKFYAIDPWAGYIGAGRTEQKQDEQDLNYKIACETLAPYPNCTIVRKSSMDALEDFKDESLDFVYLDGDHRFRYAAEDISEWEKKVRVGGIVSGHDYWNTNPDASNLLCQVKAVVDAYTNLMDIDFYITSNNRAPSWFWVKK